MKKHVYLFLSLMFCSGLFAQKGFHIGASGTFNFNMIFPQNNYGTLSPFKEAFVRSSEMDYKPTWGGNGGVVLGYNFTKNWGIQTEVQYNVCGQKYEDNFVGPAVLPEGTFGAGGVYVNVKRKINLSYVQIPLMVKFTSTKGYVAKAYVLLGPQIGIRTGAKEEVKVADIIYLPDSLAFTPSQKFRRIDMGVAIQSGVELYANDNLYFDIGLSVYQGFLDINGKVMQELGWYSQNDIEYTPSYNFRVGLSAGVHYLIGRGRTDY